MPKYANLELILIKERVQQMNSKYNFSRNNEQVVETYMVKFVTGIIRGLDFGK